MSCSVLRRGIGCQDNSLSNGHQVGRPITCGDGSDVNLDTTNEDGCQLFDVVKGTD